MAWGMLMLRVVIGVVFVGHGMQKLAGWFGGRGMLDTARAFEQVGLTPGRAKAMQAGVAEAAGGALLAVGLLTPFASALIVVAMLIAIVKVHGKNGLWLGKNGFEYNLVLLVCAVAIALVGPGDFSVDAIIGLFE